jgi:putative endonuclease
MEKRYWVYMLASQRNGTLYIGSTSDLVRRVHEHQSGAAEGFTNRYGVHRLVWFEAHESPLAMVTRERQLKKWNREWKIRLIEAHNPDWVDLYDRILR